MILLVPDLQEVGGLAETRAGRDRGPEAGVMRAEVPGGRASHAETADEDAVLVHSVVPLHVVEGFEQIDLAGQFVGVAVAAVKVQHDRVGWREFARRCAGGPREN